MKQTDTAEYAMVNSPFKWVGGKSRMRKQIIKLLPPHTCYVELFSGAAWVLFGKSPSPVEVLNDIDQDLINFFRVVKHRHQDLIAAFEWELVSRAEFERLATLDPAELDEIQRAHRFYYLIMAGWAGMAEKKNGTTRVTNREVLITNIPSEDDTVIIPADHAQTSLVLETVALSDHYQPLD